MTQERCANPECHRKLPGRFAWAVRVLAADGDRTMVVCGACATAHAIGFAAANEAFRRDVAALLPGVEKALSKKR